MKVRSIRSKVLIAITGITLLTAAAMAFVFYGRSSRMIEENYITVLSQRTRLLTDTVDDMLKNVCNIDIKASCDKEIKEELEQYLNDKDEKRLNNISTRLRTFSKMDQERSAVCLKYARKMDLQLIVCVPDERLQSLIRNVDCVYGFRRHNNQISMMHIDKGDYLKLMEG